MAENERPANAEFIGRLTGEGKAPPETRLFSGWFGDSGKEGTRRLYLDPTLSSSVDIPDDAILNTEPIRDSQPAGGVLVWVRADAQLSQSGSASSRASQFLRGQLQQDLLGEGAEKRGGYRCVTQVPCGEPTGFTGHCTKEPVVGGAWPCVTAIPHCAEPTGFTGKCTHVPWPNPTRYYGCTILHCPTFDLTCLPAVCNTVASGIPGCGGGSPVEQGVQAEKETAAATQLPGCGYTKTWGLCPTHLIGCTGYQGCGVSQQQPCITQTEIGPQCQQQNIQVQPSLICATAIGCDITLFCIPTLFCPPPTIVCSTFCPIPTTTITITTPVQQQQQPFAQQAQFAQAPQAAGGTLSPEVCTTVNCTVIGCPTFGFTCTALPPECPRTLPEQGCPSPGPGCTSIGPACVTPFCQGGGGGGGAEQVGAPRTLAGCFSPIVQLCPPSQLFPCHSHAPVLCHPSPLPVHCTIFCGPSPLPVCAERQTGIGCGPQVSQACGGGFPQQQQAAFVGAPQTAATVCTQIRCHPAQTLATLCTLPPHFTPATVCTQPLTHDFRCFASPAPFCGHGTIGPSAVDACPSRPCLTPTIQVNPTPQFQVAPQFAGGGAVGAAAGTPVGPTGWLGCTQPPNCLGPTGWYGCQQGGGGAAAQQQFTPATVCTQPQTAPPACPTGHFPCSLFCRQ